MCLEYKIVKERTYLRPMVWHSIALHYYTYNSPIWHSIILDNYCMDWIGPTEHSIIYYSLDRAQLAHEYTSF